MLLHLLLFLSTLFLGDCDEIYENSDGICQKCVCRTLSTSQDVNCADKGLQNMLANWPPNNKSVLKVTFNGNKMPTLETLPPTDAELEIILSNCEIQFIHTGVFGNTLNIKVVDLSHNQLTSEELSSDKFKGPYNQSEPEPIALEYLDLSYNRIHSLNKNLFEHTPNLKSLNLEGNDFKVLDVHTQLAIASIINLQILNLAKNELTEIEGDALRNLAHLNTLDLSKNDLDFVPETLGLVGKSLEKLILDDNPIMQFIADTFLGLGNVLDLSCNNLTKLKYVNADTFVTMPKLRRLSLSNNSLLTDIDREAFRINNTLQEFYLNNNRLYKVDHKLLKWSQLKIFEFKENPLDCSCDLYNISLELPAIAKRDLDGPHCIDPRTDQSYQVYYLKSDICSVKSYLRLTRDGLIRHHYSIPLALLSVVLVFSVATAMYLAYSRYRRFARNRYPFASDVVYDPLTTAPRF